MNLEKEFQEITKYIQDNNNLPFYNDAKLNKLGYKYMLSNAYRYSIIAHKLKPYLSNQKKCIDFGSYPGQLQDFLHSSYGVKFSLSGLHFSEEFKSFFNDWDIIDSDFEEKQDSPDRKETFDLACAFNIIEHMERPDLLLDTINYYTNENSFFFLTTDNISSLDNVRRIKKGNSPNESLIKSKIFYNGEWRPHIRIFSKDELKFLLNYSGFKVIDHDFFDHRAREYKISGDSLKLKKGLRAKLRDYYKEVYPFFKNHHIFIAQKVVKFDDLNKIRPLPTSETEKWISYRGNLSNYEIFKRTN